MMRPGLLWAIAAWVLLVGVRCASGDSDGGGIITRDYLLGGSLGALQLITLGWIRRVDGKLDRHDERLNQQAVRLEAIEATCRERHRVDR